MKVNTYSPVCWHFSIIMICSRIFYINFKKMSRLFHCRVSFPCNQLKEF